ncbi:hypothetical protein [Luteimonas lutimaris]|uniref:Uncharacterized protein n=1 Tax=Luteimonas lutimaris TaxID=698645 RepID=A0ABP7MA52_9GAMM|nr:hypothetical protein [Luteimonas sp.]
MSDEQTPYSPPRSTQPPPLPDRSGRDPRGSLGTGIGLFFASLAGGWILASILQAAIEIAVPKLAYATSMFLIPLLLPWVVALVLGLWLASRGRTRTALGMFVGFGLLGALALLLVAACFGLIAGGIGPFR